MANVLSFGGSPTNYFTTSDTDGFLSTAGFAFPTGNLASNDKRPVLVDSISASASGGTYVAQYSYAGAPYTTAAYHSTSGGSFSARVVRTSGTVSIGRNPGNGLTSYDHDGDPWAGGITGSLMWSGSPSAPRSLSIVSVGGLGIDLAWLAPLDNGGIAVSNYRIEIANNPAFTSATVANVSGTTLAYSTTVAGAGTYYVRVFARNSVTDFFGVYSVASSTQSLTVGTIWTYNGNASWRMNITNGGSGSDPYGPSILTYEAPVAFIPDRALTWAQIAFFGDSAPQGTFLAGATFQWVTSSGQILSQTVLPNVLVADETTHLFQWPDLSKPLGAVTARILVTLPQFHSSTNRNVATGTSLYIDGAIIGNGHVVGEYMDGNTAGANWAGATNNSPSYVQLGDSEPVYEADSVLSVSDGETKRVVLRTSSHLLTIEQPVPSDFTPTPLGTYYVVDGSGAHVSSATWSTAGAYVTAAKGVGLGEIDIVLSVPYPIPGHTGPYRLASSDDITATPELRLSGTAVADDPAVVRIPTGSSVATREIAASSDSPFLVTYDDVYRAGSWASAAEGGGFSSIVVTLPTNRLAGFGASTGALVRYRDTIYRVIDITLNGLQATITALWFTRIEDKEAAWDWATIDEYDEAWYGRKAKDQVIAPLKNSPNYIGLWPSENLWPSEDLWPSR